jgi:beta-glucanase (GH16 family)
MLTWSDEFEVPDGTPLDPSKWAQEPGGDGGGNHELQFYTQGGRNVAIRDGKLVITAEEDLAMANRCWYGPCRYTSARLNTYGTFRQQYGRFEARIKLPTGQGLWPTFWLLGQNSEEVGWPRCGEIDIMEALGQQGALNHSTIHGPSEHADEWFVSGTYRLPAGSLADDFHIYAVEWDASGFQFFVDDTLFETQTRAAKPDDGGWPFDQPFYIMLNVAVGGDFPGSPDATTVFPQEMLVDWVRVYQKTDSGSPPSAD